MTAPTQNAAPQGQVDAGERTKAESSISSGGDGARATGETQQAGYNPAVAALRKAAP